MKIGNSILARDMFGNIVMLPAMEADPVVPDITRTTSNMMRQASSRRNPSVTAEGSPAEPTATKPESSNQPEDGSPADPLDSETPTDTGEQDAQDTLPPDEDQLDEFGGGMDDMGGDNNSMGMDGEEQLTKEQAAALTRLHGNLTMLFQSVTTLSESLGNYASPMTTSELRKVYNAATDHLSNTKEYLAEILSTPFSMDSYPEKLRKFVALKNVYNLVCDMLKIHFGALNLENGATP